MQSLPVVIIRCEENEIYQLDFRIQTDNIRCFILLSGLRKRYLWWLVVVVVMFQFFTRLFKQVTLGRKKIYTCCCRESDDGQPKVGYAVKSCLSVEFSSNSFTFLFLSLSVSILLSVSLCMSLSVCLSLSVLT